MLPFEVPPDTTLDSLFSSVLPKAHAQMVPPTAGRDRFAIVQHVKGYKTFTLEVEGAQLRVREGDVPKPDFWLLVERDAAEHFLGDWIGPKTLLPASMPKDVVAVSDPRVLKRLALVSAKAELALTDVGGRRIAMTAACGAAAKKPIEADDPDVVLEASATTFTRLLDGSLPPEDAIVDGAIVVRGKRLLAMQFAFAFAPFYPKR